MRLLIRHRKEERRPLDEGAGIVFKGRSARRAVCVCGRSNVTGARWRGGTACVSMGAWAMTKQAFERRLRAQSKMWDTLLKSLALRRGRGDPEGRAHPYARADGSGLARLSPGAACRTVSMGTGVHGPYAPTEGSAGGCARLELTRGLT